ncbi:MAG: YybS family protein [Deltaproteobacteria bacterium]|nr:YybS family protein [Deltaproteobacteria bacterium]
MFRLRGGGVPYRDFFLAVAVTSAVFTTVAVISVLGVFGALVAPVPVLYYYSRLGRLPGILVFALSLAVTLMVLRGLNLQIGLVYFFLLGSLGVVLSEVLRKDWSIEKTVIYCGCILLSLGFIVLAYLSLTYGKMPWSVIETPVSAMVHENIDMYSRAGVPAQHIELIRENADQITRILVGLFPSVALVGTIFLVWVSILEGKWLFRKKGMWYPSFGDLSLWKTFDKTIWLGIVAGIFVMIPLEGFRILGLNVLIVLLFIYMLQGVAIMSFFFQRKNVPVLLRVFGYFLIFAQQFLLLIVAVAGLVDTWVDFRKLAKKSG